jgi:hypothetical protein
MTFSAYLDDVLSRVFPDGYSTRVKARYRSWLRDFLIEAQRYIPSLQTAHLERIGQDATFFSCGTSAFQAPPGRIRSFHTVLACDECDKVTAVPYTPTDFRKMLEERGTGCHTTAAGECDPCYYEDIDCLETRHEPYPYYEVGGAYFPYPDNLPLGLQYATNHIDRQVRSRVRSFALYDGFVWTWPVIQSNEIGVLRWHGVKKSWKDSDEMPWKDEAGDDLREIAQLAELFLGWKSKLHDDCDEQGAATLKSEYDGRFAEFLVDQKHLNLLPMPNDCFP